ncbi:MAG: hypothetical protein K1X78_19410 [Verrucomicrobiaceae bacterium]|nr:hypothetical protein [Verrucomicrobiaceae bacterium]
MMPLPILSEARPLRSLVAGLVCLTVFGPEAGIAQAPPMKPGQPVGGVDALAGPMDDNAMIKINFTNTPVQAIVPLYERLTGKKIITDSALTGESMRINALNPLPKKKAISFIEASLLLNGYAIIPVDKDTVKLLHHSGGKSPGAENLPVFNSINDLPEGEQIVHFVMPLQHISPDEASKAFQAVIKLHSYGVITPVVNAAALIITENSATIRSIFEIAQIIDVPPADIANEMIKLERSDAESIAEILNDIYGDKEKDKTSTTSQRQQNQQNPQAVPNTPGQPAAPNSRSPAGGANGGVSTSDTNPSVAKVKIIPYRRTNQLLVIARPVDITAIKALVAKLDQQADDATFLKTKLKYMPVGDFLSVAYKALAKDTDIQSDSGGPTGSSRGPKLSGSSSTPSTQARNTGSYNGSTTAQQSPFNSPFGGSTSFGNQGGMFGGATRSVLSDPDHFSTPDSVIVGKTLLIADPQSNSLIVSGSPEHINTIQKLIHEMDTRPQQIYINTVIGQLNLGADYEYGFDFLKLLDNFTLRQVKEVTVDSTSTSTTTTGSGTTSTTTTAGTTTATGTTGTSTDTTTTGTTAGTTTNPLTQLTAGTAGVLETSLNLNKFNFNQLNLYGQIGNLGQYLRLIDQDKNFKVLSRPSVYARNNTKAVISSGQRIAVPTNILSNGASVSGGIASTSASIDYRDVVLKLEVIPLINSDDEVTLKISQLNDNIVGTQIISNNTIPTIGTQELNTEITVKSGQTVVLGGLITEKDGKNGNGVLFLRRIPLIGSLFGTTTKNRSREELLIFIQPQIIKQADPLDKPNDFEMGRTRVLEETLRFNAPKQLPPSQSLKDPSARKPVSASPLKRK